MKRILVILCCWVVLSAGAQDLHFSQFYASPLTLNPARTGMFNGDFRIGGNFKNQWRWANEFDNYNYQSFSLYGDMSFLQGTLPKKDKLGVGAVFLYDRAGDGNLAITKIFLSAAYHKSIGAKSKSTLSFGLQGGYVQKSIDYDRLFFDDQWADNLFDLDIQSAEPQSEDGLSYFDMGAGITYTYDFRPDRSVSIGFAALHLTRPTESFFNDPVNDNQLGIRPIINAQSYYQIKPRWSIEPSIMWMYQKKAQEIVMNALAGYQIYNGDTPSNSKLYFGVSYRLRDALIPVIGYQFSSIRILMNYDINLSSLTDASNGIGGFELSVVYVGNRPGAVKKKTVPCPRL